MCFPAPVIIALAGAAASAAGSAYNSSQQAKFTKAQTKANNEAEFARIQAKRQEAERQKKIDAENFAEVRDTHQQVAPDKRADDAAVAAAAPDNRIKQAADRYDAPVAATTDAGEVIGDAAKLREEAGRTSSIIDALAMLSAQSTGTSGAGDAFTRLSSTLQNNRSRGERSLRVNDYESAVPAARVQRPTSPIGDILIAGGNAAAGYGGSKMDGLDFGSWDDLRRPFITPGGAMHGGGR